MTRFDESLPTAIEIVRKAVGAVPHGMHAVRDMTGALTLVWPDAAPIGDAAFVTLRETLHSALQAWSAGLEQVLIRSSDLIDPSDVLQSPDRRTVRVVRAGGEEDDEVVLVDRLVTNQEWLREPLRKIGDTKIAAAFSIKGGVGRTTSLVVWAWGMAREGKRVLVIDLDLEAPGIISVLSKELPAYGVTDWLVEALAYDPDERFLDDCIQPWFLNTDLIGSVHVLPAFGQETQSYIEKLGRVFGSNYTIDGGFTGFSERLNRLLQALERTGRYDVVLIDSRAGLHDIGASVVTRLGAEVFMFARDDPQSWNAYRQLFRHLRYSHAIHWNKQGDDLDLRWHLKMVGAQAAPEESARLAFISHSYDCWLDLYDASIEPPSEANPDSEFNLFSFTENDVAAPHHPILVPFDPRVRSFDFSSKESLPAWDVVVSNYGTFMQEASKRLFPSESEEAR